MKIIAPAGCMESFEAALLAGADEIYMGIKGFGARRGAKNFTLEEYETAIEKAHRKGVKVLLTLNTLMRDSEIEGLATNVARLYRHGLSAVIVQDLGLFHYLKTKFPEMVFHASTQMNASTHQDIEFLKSIGFQRVVLPRELSLKQISSIRLKTKTELEVFVSGAICIGVSGRCTMSSAIGNRSGNRGMCTQGCRKAYRSSESKKELFHLSPKDQHISYEEFQQLKSMGVDAIKIEGRMKSPEYVFEAVSTFKTWRDVGNQEMTLSSFFNRGYSHGYFSSTKELMSLHYSSHRGEVVGKIERGILYLTHDLHQADGIVMVSGDFKIVEQGYANQLFSELKVVDKCIVSNQRVQQRGPLTIYRNYDYQAHQRNEKKRHIASRKQLVRGEFLLTACDATLTLKLGTIVVTCQESIQELSKQPIDPLLLKEKLEKAGDEDFELELSVVIQESGFLPLSSLKNLRRHALEQLRMRVDQERLQPLCENEVEKQGQVGKKVKIPRFCALYMNEAQHQVLQRYSWIEAIHAFPTRSVEEFQQAVSTPYTTHYSELLLKHRMIDEVMNVFNSYAISFYEHYTDQAIYLSSELTVEEIGTLRHENPLGVVVYGKPCVMYFSQKTDEAFQFKKLYNEYQDEFERHEYHHERILLKNEAKNVYTKIKNYLQAGVEYFRFDFTNESSQEIEQLLNSLDSLDKTRGFRRERVL